MRTHLRKIFAATGVLIFVCVSASLLLCLFSAIKPIFASAGGGKIGMAHIAKVAWFTLWQAALSTFISCAIGIPMAFFCGRREFFGRKFLLSLSAVPFCVPALIVALGYISFFGISGTANRILKAVFSLEETPLTFLYSYAGLVVAQGFYNFPIVMKTVSDAFERLPGDKAEAARLLGAGEFRIFRTITLYQILPAIVSASIPVFIYCFMSFMMVLLFGAVGCATLEVEIFQARNAIDFKSAGLLSLVETATAISVVAAQCALEEKGSRLKGISSERKLGRKRISGWKEILPFALLAILVLAFFICPLAGIFEDAFTRNENGGKVLSTKAFRNMARLRGFSPALGWTFICASSTGLLCSVVGFTYSVWLNENSTKLKSHQTLLRMIPAIPMAVSSVVVALGLSSLVKRGSVPLLILAETALFWPVAFNQIHAQISKIPRSTIEAAKILSKDNSEIVFRIYLPSAFKGILGAFCFCFSVSAGDTTLPLVLSIPKFDTLALFTYRLAGAYRFHEAATAGAILGALCVAFFAMSNALSKNKKGNIKK